MSRQIVFRGSTCDRFELLVETREVIESRLKTDLFDVKLVLYKQLSCITDSEFS